MSHLNEFEDALRARLNTAPKAVVGCGSCKVYSFPLKRCLDGKVNPRQRNQTKAAMECYYMLDGDTHTICNHNKWKKELEGEVQSTPLHRELETHRRMTQGE